jgi:uncharacterized caspase-like protein
MGSGPMTGGLSQRALARGDGVERRIALGSAWRWRLVGGLAAFVAAASPALAERYALVVGIDRYAPPIPSLHGAVADARDIAAALEAAGTRRTILLTDEAATKEGVEAAWRSLVDEAAPGDTIVFTYAGHGAQEPAAPGDPEEPDGLDETFALSGFALSGPGLAERLVDNEVAQWLKDAEARKLKVVFVADACHSGTMYRSVPAGLSYRAVPKLQIDRAELLAFAPPAPIVSERVGAQDSVTFLAGVADGRLVPEVTIGGVARGALSYAFARAVEGAADADGDGTVTERELVGFVRATVQQRTESQQVPQSFPAVSRAIPLFEPGPAAATPMTPAAGGLLSLAFRNGTGPETVPGARIVAKGAEADLVYDVAARRVEKPVAGVVAEEVDPEGLGGIVAKWRAIAVLREMATHGIVGFDVAGGARSHERGERLVVALAPTRHRYLTLFNLPPNGRVEFLYPLSADERDADWSGRTFALPLAVRDPPFGAEHLVAILSDHALDGLHDGLRGLRGGGDAADLPDMLRHALKGVTVAIGVADIYTTGGGS